MPSTLYPPPFCFHPSQRTIKSAKVLKRLLFGKRAAELKAKYTLDALCDQHPLPTPADTDAPAAADPAQERANGEAPGTASAAPSHVADPALTANGAACVNGTDTGEASNARAGPSDPSTPMDVDPPVEGPPGPSGGDADRDTAMKEDGPVPAPSAAEMAQAAVLEELGRKLEELREEAARKKESLR